MFTLLFRAASNKIAAVQNRGKEASLVFVSSDDKSCVSEFQSCDQVKKDVQVLMNELKSMSAIINVVKEGMVNNSAMNQDRLPKSVSELHPSIPINMIIALNLTTN
jgi:hypothetical protein